MQMKRSKRKLKTYQTELIALVEYMMAEAYEVGKEKHYRVKIPYGPDSVELVLDLSVYFDGELQDDNTGAKFKIAGPDKKRH